MEHQPVPVFSRRLHVDSPIPHDKPVGFCRFFAADFVFGLLFYEKMIQLLFEFSDKIVTFAEKLIRIIAMSTMELEAQKASLARKILHIDDENMLHNIWLLLNDYNPVVSQQEMTHLKRQIGILDGKAKIVFKENFEMTTEELLGLQ